MRGREKVKELSQQEGTYAEQLELIKENIGASEYYLNELSGRIDEVSTIHSRLGDSLHITQIALTDRRSALAKRLRAIYRVGRPDVLEILMTSRSVGEVLRRVQFFKDLNRYDRMLVLSIDSTRIVVADHLARYNAEERKLVNLKQTKEDEKQALLKVQDEQNAALEGVRKEKETYLARVQELVRSQRELNALLRKLKEKEARAAAAKAAAEKAAAKVVKRQHGKTAPALATTIKPGTGLFAHIHGLMPWPVVGRIIKPYGRIVHPIYQTVTQNDGVDIAAPRGTPADCVAAGTVEYVGFMRGYGNFVIVNHDDGYRTIYAHLDRITVSADQTVKAGVEVGTVGDSGGASDQPGLQFQIRHESETLDPSSWLSQR